MARTLQWYRTHRSTYFSLKRNIIKEPDTLDNSRLTLTLADRSTPEALSAALSASMANNPWAFRQPGGALYLLVEGGTRVLGPFKGGSVFIRAPLVDALLFNCITPLNANGIRMPLTDCHIGKAADLVALELLRADYLPTIEIVVREPGYRFAGDRLARLTPGRHGTTLVSGNRDLLLSDTTDPTYPFLRLWLSGLHWSDPRHLGNLLGWIVASFARSAIREFPHLILSGTHKSVGKSTVAEAIRTLHGQSHLPALTFTGDEHEFENRLGAFAGDQPGPTLIQIENVRPKRGGSGEIRSQALSAAATGWSMPARKLYLGPTSVHLPVVMFTMNGAKLEADLADKTLTVTMTRGPTGAAITNLDPHPIHYAKQNLHALLNEIHHILGSTALPTPRQTRLFDFERVARAACLALRLPHDYAPGGVDTTDVGLIELESVVSGDGYTALGPTYVEAVRDIRAHARELPELAGLLLTMHQGSDKAQAYYLRSHVQAYYLDKPFHLRGRIVTIHERTDASGTAHLYLTQVEPFNEETT